MAEKRNVLIATVGTSDFVLPPALQTELGRKIHRDNPVLRNLPKAVEDLDEDKARKLTKVLKRADELRSQARSWGQKFYDKPDEKYIEDDGRKVFPIIGPITEVNDPDTKIKLVPTIKRIYLLATDNKANPNRENDTIYYARIIEKWLKTVAKSLSDCEINIIRLGGDAEAYDTIYSEIAGEFEKLADDNDFKQFDDIYILATGGTGAMTMATIVAGSRVFGQKARPLYTQERDESKGQSAIRPLEIGNILYLQRLVDDIKRLVYFDEENEAKTTFEYKAALTLVNDLDNWKLLTQKWPEHAKALRHLLHHAEQRLLFNLDAADEELKAYLAQEEKPEVYGNQNDNGLRAYYVLPYKEVAASNQAKAQIEALKFGLGAVAELYWNVDLQWRMGHYADYVARLKTLTDRLNVFALELVTGIPFSFEEASHNQKQLKDHKFASLGYGLKNALEARIPLVERTEIDDVAKLTKLICTTVSINQKDQTAIPGLNTYLVTQLPLDLLNPMLKQDRNFHPAKIDDYWYKDFADDKGESLDKLLDLLKAIDDTKNGNSEGPMYRLTRLRNSLPPAHSFGKISLEVIKDATGADAPPHYRIGKILEEFYCWQDFFSDQFYVSTNPFDSPFVTINRRAQTLLEKLQEAKVEGGS